MAVSARERIRKKSPSHRLTPKRPCLRMRALFLSTFSFSGNYLRVLAPFGLSSGRKRGERGVRGVKGTLANIPPLSSFGLAIQEPSLSSSLMPLSPLPQKMFKALLKLTQSLPPPFFCRNLLANPRSHVREVLEGEKLCAPPPLLFSLGKVGREGC